MKTRFLDAAKAEFAGAVEYYNLEREGLGFEFAAEVRRTIERILQYPEAWPAQSEQTRRCRCNRFPYAVLYTVRDDDLVVVAVMHMRRDPEVWQARLEGSCE